MFKVCTVVGTRPEIIKLSEVIKALDLYTEHTLVHTGQHYDSNLSDVFFEDLELEKVLTCISMQQVTPLSNS